MSTNGITRIVVLGVFAAGFLLALYGSLQGYGYIGYHDYREGPTNDIFVDDHHYYHSGYAGYHGGYRGTTARGGGPRGGK